MWKQGLEPIITHDTEILILGSLPSDESIKQQRYYAKPNNDFWKLIGETIGKNLIGLDYEERCRILLENKIGLWDVFHKCERAGSLDSDIKGRELNDFSKIKAAAPNIKLICFNGKLAGESEELFIEKGYKTKVLPSSSGANRRNSEARLQEWKSMVNNMQMKDKEKKKEKEEWISEEVFEEVFKENEKLYRKLAKK